MNSNRHLLATAVRWLNEGHRVAIATVVSTWGSSPRRPGAVMVVNDAGDFAGSVSGGCVESAVLDEAAALMERGGCTVLEYGVSSEKAWEVGLACGGTVRVHLQAVEDRTWLDDVLAGPDTESDVEWLSGRKEGMVVALQMDSGDRTLLAGEDTLTDAAAAALAEDESRVVETADGELFLHVLNPPVRVLIVGAVHIAQQLAVMAAAAGYEVAVVDPRTAFATPERFPGVAVVSEWPDPAFARLGLDRRTAVVTVTHDPKLDDPALTAALDSDVFYIGALGSRRTHQKRVDRLAGAGIDPARLDRIHAPIGLDIGARSPGEIAAAILAQVVETLRRPDA
jgi:xanthine dehydrogenase accessory factor